MQPLGSFVHGIMTKVIDMSICEQILGSTVPTIMHLIYNAIMQQWLTVLLGWFLLQVVAVAAAAVAAQRLQLLRRPAPVVPPQRLLPLQAAVDVVRHCNNIFCVSFTGVKALRGAIHDSTWVRTGSNVPAG